MPEVSNPLGHEHFQALAILYGDQPYVQARIKKAEAAASLMPMSLVLERVLPGKSVGEKCKKIGIKRATWYTWMNSQYRPNEVQAKRLQRLTGIPKEKFQARR
jgi:hypothetical protein